MDSTGNDLILFLLGILLIISITNLNSYRSGYKKGQINALNGKILYHLVTNDNNEVIWEKVKK